MKMVNCLVLLITGLLIGVDSRTIDPSNLIEAIKASSKHQASKEDFPLTQSESKDEALNSINFHRGVANGNPRLHSEDFSQFIATQSVILEKLLAEFAAKTGNVKNYEERMAQWLRQLKLMLQLMSNGVQIEKSKRNENRISDEIGEIGTASLPIINRKMIGGNDWIDDLLEHLDEQDIDAQSTEENESHVKSRYEDSSTSFSLTDENHEELREDRFDDEPSAEEFDNMLIGVQNDISIIRRYFEKLCSKHHSTSSSASHSENHNHEQSSRILPTKKISKI